MKHIEDAPWHQAKKRIAEANGELTMLWYVGKDLRDAAAEQNLLTDWKHPNFDLEEVLRLDPTGHLWDRTASCHKDKGAKLAQILEVNRPKSETLVTPERVESARELWDVPTRLEFFVDFETCSDLDDDFSQLPAKNGQALIFMIGCGHFDESGVWRFRVFTAKRLAAESEGEILIQWLEYMDEVSSKSPEHSNEPVVFHWSPAETSTLTTAYNSAAQRHPEIKPVNWFDFLNLVVKPTGTSCLAVKGALGFGLKAIGKALYSQGKIATSWQDGPTDGLGAMVGAWWCYREADQRGCIVQDVRTPDRDGEIGRALMREIESYNEIDCKVMAEIICYIRSNH
jgi:hypothetical protein